MELTIKSIPNKEIAVEILNIATVMIDNYLKSNIQIPITEIQKYEADLSKFKLENDSTKAIKEEAIK